MFLKLGPSLFKWRATVNPLVNARGNVILGALAAITATGMVSVGMLASYDSYLKQARMNYVRAAQIALDHKIRFMAMQPYAYLCGAENSRGRLEGIDSCRLNTAYFQNVAKVSLPGDCRGPTCEEEDFLGFRIVWDPDQPDPALKQPFQIRRPAGGPPQGVLFYNLVYTGKDFSLRPGGFELIPGTDRQRGMDIPIEILQSENFDCAAANNGNSPIFRGFQNGRPVCHSFPTCPQYTYAANVNFTQGTVQCRPLGDANPAATTVNCEGGGQRKISRFDWNAGRFAHECTELPIPQLNGTYSRTTTTAPPDPPEPPAQQLWTWRGLYAQTTCPFLCDGVEWAECTGSACAAPYIQCYSASWRGVPSHPIGSTQTTQPSGYQCFLRPTRSFFIW